MTSDKPNPRAGHPAVPRRGRQRPVHRPAGSGQDHAVGRPRPRRGRGRHKVLFTTLDEESRSLLFEVINARYLKDSIITTSHVGIASWAERLGDPMLAAAALE